ncbi:MAG: ABC transporter permease [Verrucomicrobiales bacterium]|nr:ABC transporter permease [Verrucomicrobiales bacterium]
MKSWRAAWTLALRYTLRHPLRSGLLAAALGLVMALPWGLRSVVDAADAAMRERAAATPLVLGRRGSALDLVLTALHFRQPPPAAMTLGDARAACRRSEAVSVPVYVRFQARGFPIVGTELDYFSQRRLTLAAGRAFTQLGDCVVGAAVAEKLGLQPGSALISSPEQSFDLDGVYPLKMRVTGVLAAGGQSDDHAVFADLKTTWLIEGLAHGHQDMAQAGDEAVLSRDAANGEVVANASVRLYNEVTEANRNSFHFHGDFEDLPVTAALIWPVDARADALITARFRDPDEPLQIVSPAEEVAGLMASLFQLERLVLGLLALASATALLVCGLVFGLSFRLRRDQFTTLEEIGVSRAALRGVKLTEIALVLILAAGLATVGVALVAAAAPTLVRLTLS